MSLGSFLVAAYIAIMGLEDFSYFLIQSLLPNWRTPNALQRVIFKKDFAWFKPEAWFKVRLGRTIFVPKHWLFLPLISIALLCFHYWIKQ
jgi:hypothetical protein